MDKKKKIIIGIFITIFLLVNLVWYAGMLRPYLLLKKQMEHHPHYIGSGEIVDEDGYTYAIHYPTYLYFKDGNLSISAPLAVNSEIQSEDGKTTYTANAGDIIIWLNRFTGDVREIGVELNANGDARDIYLVDSGTARYEEDQIYVDESQEIIKTLFEKTEEAWNLEMPWKE